MVLFSSNPVPDFNVKEDASAFSIREFSKVTLMLKPCDNKNKGRGVFYKGKEELAPGKVILVSPHLGFLRFPDSTSSYCAECNSMNSASEWICCSFCTKRWYCSPSCQRINWYRLHQLECALLGTPFYLHEPQQLKSSIHLLRSYWLMLWCHRAQLDKRLWKDGTPVSSILLDTFNSLPSHSSSSYSTSAIKGYEAVASLAQDELEWVFTNHPRLSSCDEVFEPTLLELIDTLKVFSSNNFSLIDSEMIAVGEATFPVGSLINHSCVPNCMYSNSFLEELGHQQVDSGGMGGAQSIITIRPISPGEEITVAYLDVALDKKARQNKLLESYHFRCSCDLCFKDSPSSLCISPRDPNFSLYEELMPQACYLNWHTILHLLVKPLVSSKELLDTMLHLLTPWLYNVPLQKLLNLSSQRCFKILNKTSPKGPASLLDQATQSILHWLNNYIHPAQIAKANRINLPIPSILPVCGHVPLPSGIDSLVHLNKDHDPALPPAYWTGDLSTANNPAFYQTVGRLLSSSIQLVTFHKVYGNPYHPVLNLRLIELGKLWFNLGPMLAPKGANESCILLADFLALFYLTMAFASIPASDARQSWSTEVPLVADLIATTSGIVSELTNILQDHV
ncbi:hypothetical protein DSO57_1035138 [Entomophthora muscae]|uniref:Uncharacterized protein n=1 Tax=Entomophthora muscae TaxID=34485 RepID=A0ACC2S1V3_9FUNG|nr:hypothetical protein DSO57_1035138 [Entomophthora muscae]